MKKAVGCKVARVVGSGSVSSLLYGAEVYGLDNSEDKSLRMMMAASYSGISAGMSLHALTALVDQVSWRGTAAPLLRWAAEVWQAANGAMAGHSRGLTLPQLRQAWQECFQQRPLRWSQVRGPIGAALLCIDRLGWSWPGPFVMVSPRGEHYKFTEHSPAMVANVIRRAYREKHETLAARRVGADGADVSLDRVRKLLRGNRLLPSERACLLAACSHRIWTADRLHEKGLSDSNLCPLCCCCVDSEAHRAFFCDRTRHIREAVLSEKALAFVRQQSDTDEAKWTLKGFCPVQLFRQDDVRGDDCYDFWSISGRSSPGPLDFRGRVFIDGSGYKGVTEAGNRAGWSAVEIDEQGRPICCIAAPVAKELPQTSQAAENCAVAGLAEITSLVGGTRVWSDYLGLVSVLQQPLPVVLSPKRMYAGILRAAVGATGWKTIDEVVWVKSHQDIDAIPVGTESWLTATGNKLADEWAKKGAMLRGPSEDPAKAEHWAAVTDDIAVLVAKVGVFSVQAAPPKPAKEKKAKRAPRPSRPPEARRHEAHHFWFFAGPCTWRCGQCFRTVKSGAARRRADGLGCPQDFGVLAKIFADPKGHTLAAYQVLAGAPTASVVACLACGAWSEGSLPKGLAARCLGKPTARLSHHAGLRALRKLELGQHPNHHYEGARVGPALQLWLN